jgi:radical SAM superfamily enzyme YgiQ (UPF0313 family)
MAKNILLISPLEDFLINPKEFLPLGILYLSSFLKKKGIEVDVLHGDPTEIKKEYDFYGISSTTSQYNKARLFKNYIKERNPSAKIVLGGAHTKSPKCSQESLEDGFDYVVVGQGEKTLLKIIEGKENKGIISGEPLNHQEIDEALPDRDALDITKYGYPLVNGMAATIITARGCPYKCSFCSYSQDRLMFRSHEKVLEEVDLLVNKYGFNRLLFVDDSFTANKTRIKNILSGIEKYNILYRCYARADNSNDKEVLQMLLSSGCIELGVGIESGSQMILDLSNKKTKVDKNLEFIKTTQEIGIGINAFVMIGLPGESKKTIEETREFMEKAKPQKFGYNIFTPYPDSPIIVNYDKPFESGKYIGKSFKDFITLYDVPYDRAFAKAKTIGNCFVSTPDLSREEIINFYHQEFEKFVQITGFDPRKREAR